MGEAKSSGRETMNATSYIEPLFQPARPQPPVLHVIPAPRAPGDLAIDEPTVARWRALDDAKRARVAAFLADTGVEMSSIRVTGNVPENFARDLGSGGRTLRAAFPRLVRRVTGVLRHGEHTRIVVACEGEHLGPFFRLFSPTGRRVGFNVVHRLVARDGTVVEHRVTLDVRALIVQLATAPKQVAL
jgi:hypothetical protein